MNSSLHYISFILLFFIACTSTKKETPKNIVQLTNTDTLVYPISNAVITPPKSGVINVSLKDGEGNYLIHKQEDQIIYLNFESEGHKQLSAQIIPLDSNANVRFSQIILPNGIMDGPFGRELNYTLSANGEYQISLHEDMMAGEPWDGEFVVKIQVHDLLN